MKNSGVGLEKRNNTWKVLECIMFDFLKGFIFTDLKFQNWWNFSVFNFYSRFFCSYPQPSLLYFCPCMIILQFLTIFPSLTTFPSLALFLSLTLFPSLTIFPFLVALFCKSPANFSYYFPTGILVMNCHDMTVKCKLYFYTFLDFCTILIWLLYSKCQGGNSSRSFLVFPHFDFIIMP